MATGAQNVNGGSQLPGQGISPRQQTTVTQQKPLEDPLAHLPCTSIIECRKDQVIYDHDQAISNLYLVIEGKVKVTRMTKYGHQVLVDVYQADEFFGEAVFEGLPKWEEQAVALGKGTKLMSWSMASLEDIIMHRPKLAIAYLQIFIQRENEFVRRIVSFSTENIEQRLARALIRFSERFGEGEEDGAVRMCPFTHELFSLYVGTSREILTHYMNTFRRMGYLKYSRKGIIVYRDGEDGLGKWLQQQSGRKG